MKKTDLKKEVNKWTKGFLKNRLEQRKTLRKELKEMYHLSTQFPKEEVNKKYGFKVCGKVENIKVWESE